MGNKAKLIERMRYWCDEGNLGYDQGNRWDIRYGGECDCSSLIYWVLWEAGYGSKPANPWNHTLYTGTLQKDLLSMGFTKVPNNGKPQPGDILLNDTHHVAMCTGNGILSQASIDENGRARGGAAGDQNGRETNTKNYYNYPWNAYYRPPADGSSVPSNPVSSGKLEEDGLWGNATTLRLQQYLGTPADGVIDGQDSSLDRVNRGGLLSSTWKKGTGGSTMVRALQRKIGVDDDGYFGPDSCRNLQRYLGTPVDGVVDKPSDMVLALQKRLNNNTF